MNRNYHYYTVKTLARCAGFGEEAAQIVAHFSHRIDDFIMSTPIIVNEEESKIKFFQGKGKGKDENLVLKLHKDIDNMWLFLPCPTGVTSVSIVRSLSRNYQLRTLMPFHFIMDVPWTERPENPDRSFFRCTAANVREDLLINNIINRIVGETAKSIDQSSLRGQKPLTHKDKVSLMGIGMILHTYADTYAHHKFSGFHGWENEVRISEVRHYSRKEGHPGELDEFEKGFFSRLPSVAHTNAFSVPDFGDCYIKISGKEKERGGMADDFIERKNWEHFTDCSKRIFDMFCEINKEKSGKADWEDLRTKISDAQKIKPKKNNGKEWEKLFRNYKYKYKKSEFLNAKLKVMHSYKNMYNYDITELLRAENKALYLQGVLKILGKIVDIDSGTGDEGRAGHIVLAKKVSELFYDYNERAYRHVYETTGRYASRGRLAQFAAQHKLIERVINENPKLKKKLGGR